MGQQHRRGLGPYPGHPGDVVHRVATQGQVVGDLVGVHAVPGLDPVGAPAGGTGVVPLFVVFAQQLRQVLVGRHDQAAVAGRAGTVQGAADQVVGFVLAVGQHRQAERGAQRLAVGELALEFLRGRLAVGLVVRVEAMTEAAVQGLVEGDGDVVWALAFEQVQQEAGEAVHRVGWPALGVAEFVGHRMPGPEHVQAGIHQVQGRPRGRVHGVQSASRACGSGRWRSGASRVGVPIWMKPTMHSPSARPR